MRLPHPGGFRLERIEIEVKGKAVERLACQVVVGQRLGGINGVLGRIVLRIDLVSHASLRQRPRNFRSKSALRNCRSAAKQSDRENRQRSVTLHRWSPRNSVLGYLFTGAVGMGSINPMATSTSSGSTGRVLWMASISGIVTMSVPRSATITPKSPLWTWSMAPIP